MHTPFFSIIVPVYNVEKYIIKCIESILSQNFTNFEILIIDDETQDNSINIINNHFNDNRIRVFHKKNGGLSDARNYGLNNALGKYVWFIDSDDSINQNNALELLYKNIISHKNIEIAVFNALVLFENNSRPKSLVDNVPCNTAVISGYDYIKTYNQFPYNAWCQCFKRDFLIENNLYYTKGLYFEDIFQAVDCYSLAKEIIGIKESLYTYYRRSGSITQSKINSNHLTSQAKVLKKLYDAYLNKTIPTNYLVNRLSIDLKRLISFYTIFNSNKEDQNLEQILKGIKIPLLKGDLLVEKIQKTLFYYFPMRVLKNHSLFKKLETVERRLKTKN